MNNNDYIPGILGLLAGTLLTLGLITALDSLYPEPDPLEDFRCIEYAGTMQPENCVIWLRRGEPWPPEWMERDHED